MTPNQARDNLLEAVPLTTDVVTTIKNMGLDCNRERAADLETYSKCPRCYGLHSTRGNFDNLCDGCGNTILEYFPNHESVPHIKASAGRWSRSAP